MRAKETRPTKQQDVLKKIYNAIARGLYRDTRHSTQRRLERGISLPDILEVLETGFHEKSKDEYRPEFKSWNYAIRGKTLDGETLRIAVYFEKNTVMIATVIRL